MNFETNSLVAKAGSDINSAKCKQVKACIESYLLKNTNLTLMNVKEKTSVPHSTLRRLMSGTGNPETKTVAKILRSLGYEAELSKYLEEFDPEFGLLMSSTGTHNQEYEFVSNEDRKYFTDEQNFLILSLAYTTTGTTEKEIRFELGERGIAKLNELVDKGLILKQINGRIVGKFEDFKFPLEDVKKRIEYAMKHYRLEESGNINNWLSYQTESVNEEGLKVLKELNRKHFNERKEQVFNNPVYLGNHKVYSASVTSTFVAYQDSGASK